MSETSESCLPSCLSYLTKAPSHHPSYYGQARPMVEAIRAAHPGAQIETVATDRQTVVVITIKEHETGAPPHDRRAK